MALDPGSAALSGSPESSGRDSPIPRQWRNQLGGEESPIKDKAFRRYAAGVEKALSLFETALEEWADYISFLNRVLKALQARPSSFTTIPAKATLSKRLSQCLNPSLPSGVHQKALEVYTYVFDTIGRDGLSRDLPLYLPGLAPTLSFASLSVRSPFLDLLEKFFLELDARSLRPAMRSIILALLPGLEDETSEDFDRTLHLVSKFKEAIRPSGSKELTAHHSSGDDFFWQCFFMASITSQSRRGGALAYLVRHLPSLGAPSPDSADKTSQDLATMVTSPEPGLLIRCFASGLADEQLLIQRGFLDLLVSHLPLNSTVLQSRVKSTDLELLLKSASGVVTRRDMSLNRRLWAWLLGPEPAGQDGDANELATASTDQQQAYLSSRTNYFEEYGLQALTKALLDMIKGTERSDATERARPYRICLSLMDRWEIGGLVVPEIFLPVIQSVEDFKGRAPSDADFKEVLRSASVFFDGIESGLIYSELVALLAQAIGPSTLATEERSKKLSLISFIIANFNVREEEMVTIHAPLTCLAALYMLEDLKDRQGKQETSGSPVSKLEDQVLSIVTSLMDLIPDRAFPKTSESKQNGKATTPSISTVDLLKKIRDFYVNEQGNLDAAPPPFSGYEAGQMLLQKAAKNVHGHTKKETTSADLRLRIRILLQVLVKIHKSYSLDGEQLLIFMKQALSQDGPLPYGDFSSILSLATQLHYADRIKISELSELVLPLVGHAWSYLSVSEPKFHVEAVRCLWQLQTALTTQRRDIEAALSTLIVKQNNNISAEMGRTFGVLWSHTLQDNQSERRGSKPSVPDLHSAPKLAGADFFEVMLTQPLFLVLDSLTDERTHLYMNVKAWLNTMIGVDRLFLLFAEKLSAIPLLKSIRECAPTADLDVTTQIFSEDDDLDLCLYYLRSLHNVLKCTGNTSWAIMGSKHVALRDARLHVSTGGDNDEVTLQEYFVRLLMRCITTDEPASASRDLSERASQLQRYAVMVLHQFLTAQQADRLSHFHMEKVLIDRLSKSLDGEDPYMQVLLLDVLHASLKLQDYSVGERPTSPVSEKFQPNMDQARQSRPSLAISENRQQQQHPSLPPQLLKCLQAGLGASRSQLVLDSWVTFLGECLPIYAGSIFQIVIPLVETLCKQIGQTFWSLKQTFDTDNCASASPTESPESTLIHLLNGLEQVLARAHDQLLADESRAQVMKGPEQQQSLFGSMVSGVFQSDAPQGRSATANDRLTVHLAFQDAVRICYKIWSWGQSGQANQSTAKSAASFIYTSLRMRNRARRLLEHLFAAEMLECLETVIGIWNASKTQPEWLETFNFLSALEASRPRQTIPALFNAIYSRTNPSALDPTRTSTLAISLEDTDLALFLVQYTRSLDDDAMDEIWQDCIIFLKDILANPFPHRQILPSLIEFAAILGEKVDNTNFGEQKKMRRELGDLFLRLLAALFTTRPITFAEHTSPGVAEKSNKGEARRSQGSSTTSTTETPRDVVGILASVVPNLTKVLPEADRVQSAAGNISSSVIGPTLRTKAFPDSVSANTMKLLHELSRLQNNQKVWKKDVGDAFNDGRFFGMDLALVQQGWLPLLKQWTFSDKEKMAEIVSRIAAPTTAGIVFGVGATSARLEADRKTQLNLRRISTLILASAPDAYVTDLPTIFDKLVELLGATSTSSPSSTTRADVYMVVRALVLRTSPVHLAMLWPVVNAELHAAMSSVVAPDNSSASDTYSNAAVLQACKLLDLLICVAPDDFQLHEWLFITDTIDAVYRSSSSQPVALADEISEDLGSAAGAYGGHSRNNSSSGHNNDAAASAADHAALTSSPRRRPLLGADGGGISDNISLERRDELVAKVLRPFFAQLSIFAFESTYAMGVPDREACVTALLRDTFEERTMVKSL